MKAIWNKKIDNTAEKITDNILDYLLDNGYITKNIDEGYDIYSIVSKELKKL